MAVIKSYENTNSITTFVSLGWLVGLIFVVFGIKLKWFRANLNVNSAPVTNNVQTGVYRQINNIESYRSLDSTPQTSQPFIKHIKKETLNEKPTQNKENPTENQSASSSNSQTSSFNIQSIQHGNSDKNKQAQNLQIKSEIKISNVPKEKSIQTKNTNVKSSEKNISTQNKPQKISDSDKNILKKSNNAKSKLNDKYKKEKKSKDDKKNKTKNTSNKTSVSSKQPLNEMVHEQNQHQKLKNTKKHEIKNEEIYETPKINSNKINIESTSNINKSEAQKSTKQFNHIGSSAYSSAAASIFLADNYDNFEDNSSTIHNSSAVHNSSTLPNTPQQISIGSFTNFEDNNSLTSNTSA